MGELMRRTGVSRATVYHYLDIGLLPAPERPNLRMAYYDPSCVERVRVIRELQERRFMPLHAIRRVLEDGGVAGVRSVDDLVLASMHTEGGRSRGGISREALLELHPVGGEVLDSLASAGLLASSEGPFCADEVAVVAEVRQMRQAGLDEGLGFSVDQMALYPAALQTLIDLEFATFNERVLGAVPSDRAADMANVAVEASSKLLAALHRRLLRERLKALVDRTEEPETDP